jgi:hypothetical protein
MGALVAVFAMLAPFGGFAALIVALVVWGKRREERRRQAWAQVAQRHGLSFAGDWMSGKKYGVDVSIALETRGSGKNKRTYTVVGAKLPVPLDLGLSLRKHGFVTDLFHKSEDIVVGDAPFDGAFIVSGDEPARVAAALRPSTRALLVQWCQQASFKLGDGGMSLERQGVIAEAAWLDWALEVCARIAHELDQARAGVPPAGTLVYQARAWHDFARARGLQLWTAPLCMWGPLEGHQVFAYAVREGPGRYAFEVSLRFAQPLGAGLSLKPEGMMDRLASFFGGDDIEIGDDAFDRAFRVKCHDAELARALLDEGVRGRLTRLQHDVGLVTLDDGGIAVRLPRVPSEPGVVPKTVQQLAVAAEEIASRGRRDASAGAYR